MGFAFNHAAKSFRHLHAMPKLSTTTKTTTKTALGVTELPTISDDDARSIFNKAKAFAFNPDYDDPEFDKHYHPLDDEKKLIRESKYLLSEMNRLLSQTDIASLSDLVEEDVAVE